MQYSMCLTNTNNLLNHGIMNCIRNIRKNTKSAFKYQLERMIMTHGVIFLTDCDRPSVSQDQLSKPR